MPGTFIWRLHHTYSQQTTEWKELNTWQEGPQPGFFRNIQVTGSNCLTSFMSEKHFFFFFSGVQSRIQNKSPSVKVRERYCGMFWSTLKVIRSGKMVQLYVNKCLVAYEDNVIRFHWDFSAEVRKQQRGFDGIRRKNCERKALPSIGFCFQTDFSWLVVRPPSSGQQPHRWEWETRGRRREGFYVMNGTT